MEKLPESTRELILEERESKLMSLILRKDMRRGSLVMERESLTVNERRK